MDLGFLLSIIALIIIVVLAIGFIWSALSNREPSEYIDIDDYEQRRAGRLGEQEAYKYISQVKRDDDIILHQVKFVYNDQECEIDYVVINKYGVYIIEVKYYSGYIDGDSSKRVWSKTKVTSSGNTYVKEFNSPLKQLNWHVDSFAKYLRENGIHVWVKGYSMILNNEHSQVDSEQVLHNIDELDKAIHTRAIENKYELSKSKIDKIIGLLNNR